MLWFLLGLALLAQHGHSWWAVWWSVGAGAASQGSDSILWAPPSSMQQLFLAM